MHFLSELLQAVALGLLALLPLANPLTSVAMFISLSAHMSPLQRRDEARMASIYTFCILIVAFYGGQIIMSVFGISIPGLRIAGGLIVLITGLRMLFPSESTGEEMSVEKKTEELRTYRSKSIAFVPIALPGTAGPGTIAMTISLSSTIRSGQIEMPLMVYWVSPLITSALLALILWVCLRSSGRIMTLLKESGIDAATRIMGFLLVCMGVQFCINGVAEIVHTWPQPQSQTAPDIGIRS